MNLKPYALLLLAASAIGADPKTDEFGAVFRHAHYFLVWNAEPTAPAIKLECVGYFRYVASLQYKIIDADSRVLAEDRIARAEQLATDLGRGGYVGADTYRHRLAHLMAEPAPPKRESTSSSSRSGESRTAQRDPRPAPQPPAGLPPPTIAILIPLSCAIVLPS